jgi:L-alanine-DL-glutamate epimerase-like enolase superfamily enzyme
MKITGVETIPLEYVCDPPVFSGGGAIRSRASLLVLVHTDAGITGLGESGVGGAPVRVLHSLVCDELAPTIVGQDPFYVERCWRLMWQRSRQHGRAGLALFGMSGIDIALWDIVGKATSTPLFKLWGAYRDRVAAYYSGGFYRSGKGLAELRDEASDAVERGFRGFKMKIGRNPEATLSPLDLQPLGDQLTNPLEHDLERVAAVREVLGPSRELMLDVNTAWSPAFAVRAARQLERFAPLWLEEPVAADDHVGSASLAAALDMSIAGYETVVGLDGWRRLIEARAIDLAQPDVTWCGGFSEARRIATLAAAHHLPVAPHVFSSAVALQASLHLAASLANGCWLEFDQNPNPLRTDLAQEPLRLEPDGTVVVPARPGLGLELNSDVVNRFRVAL